LCSKFFNFDFFLEIKFSTSFSQNKCAKFFKSDINRSFFCFLPNCETFFFCFEIFFVRIIIFFRYLFFVFKQNDKKLDYLKRSAFHIKYFKSWYLHKRGGGPLAKLFSKGKFYSRKNSFLPKRNSLFCYVKELWILVVVAVVVAAEQKPFSTVRFAWQFRPYGICNLNGILSYKLSATCNLCMRLQLHFHNTFDGSWNISKMQFLNYISFWQLTLKILIFFNQLLIHRSSKK